MVILKKQRSERGFTLVELLVVIAIIGILIGMLLPAVQSVRAAARASVCSNNQRQLALAALNYESGFQKFPPGYLGPDPGDITTSIDDDGNHQFTGAMVYLLAQMEQANIGDQIPVDYLSTSNLSGVVPWFGNPVLFGLAQATVPPFTCPDAFDSPELAVTRAHTFLDGSTVMAEGRAIMNSNFGLTNYRPCGGYLEISPTLRGVFGNRTSTDFGDIRDGTSNTLLFGESNGDENRQYTWMAGGTINSAFMFGDDPLQWGSNHVGDIVHFSFGDGSTRSISPTIDTTVLMNLSAMADGQVIGDF